MVKIQFSEAESSLMNDPSVILTKNTVLLKIRELFMHLQSDMQDAGEAYAGNDVFAIPPKISRGENYLGLPYVILDYPRIFRGGNIAAIRTMFWWGHYFSSTLHLAGDFKSGRQQQIQDNYRAFADEGYYVAIHEDQWLHQFAPEVYKPVSSLSEKDFSEQCRQFDHLKIGTTFPLGNGSAASNELMKSWRFLLEKMI